MTSTVSLNVLGTYTREGARRARGLTSPAPSAEYTFAGPPGPARARGAVRVGTELDDAPVCAVFVLDAPQPADATAIPSSSTRVARASQESTAARCCRT